uniref:Uncharacterized protein n=1 Tax=Strombidinopsis acuminata TaxID=141414 RepID=A0A7S3U989_9SPIT
MIDAEKKAEVWFETMYDRQKGESPNDKSQKYHEDVFIRLSEPLKKMQSEYLAHVVQNCYQDRHMAADFTNVAQINQCKEQTHEKVAGQFFKDLAIHRESTKLVYYECLNKTGNDIHATLACVNKYLINMQADNDKLVTKFADNYPQYM